MIRRETDFSIERDTENDIRPMTAVREKLMFGKLVEGRCVVILNGNGVGQFRAVESFTTDSINVKELKRTSVQCEMDEAGRALSKTSLIPVGFSTDKELDLP